MRMLLLGPSKFSLPQPEQTNFSHPLLSGRFSGSWPISSPSPELALVDQHLFFVLRGLKLGTVSGYGLAIEFKIITFPSIYQQCPYW